jgi:hypothetical protein
MITKDGDTILITAKVDEPTVWDPSVQVAAVGRAYRVVAVKGRTPVFELIPIGDTYQLSDEEFKRIA